MIKALEKTVKLYKEGYIPPSSINWNDADDNNAFHSKLCVMDFDGTLSTELAMLRKQKAEYNDVLTMPPPLDNNGKQMVTQIGGVSTMIPKGAKNIEVAKDFQKYIIQPEVNNEFLKGGLGRLPADDPGSGEERSVVDRSEARHPHVPPYVEQGLVSPTKPDYFAYNPAWAQVRSEHPYPGRLPRNRRQQRAAEGCGREGDQAGRGDLRQIPDQGLSAALRVRPEGVRRRAAG